MHIDARKLPDQSVIEGDICIVGAGPAGLSIALEWIGSPFKVILLEGGGYEVDNKIQDLYRGESIGQRYYPLQAARLHYFGGTSGHWGGFCSPLDPIDFKKRDWVPDSGWPISYDELQPYYLRAQEKLELSPYGFDLRDWKARDKSLESLPFNESIITHKIYQFSSPTRFGTKYKDTIEKSTNICLYTYANVTEINANESVTQITDVNVSNLEGKRFVVKARYYILACGGIENARLLLCSNRQMNQGLGNYHDIVGRYFLDHLEVYSGDLFMRQASAMKLYLLNFYVTKVRAELGVNEVRQEEEQILNGTISLVPKTENRQANIDNFEGDAEANVKMWRELDQNKITDNDGLTLHNSMVKLKQFYKHIRSSVSDFELFTRMEQSPNPHSRIFLNRERDQLGMNRVTLDWRFTSLEKRSILKLYELFGQEVGRIGIGRVKLMEWLRDPDDASWPSILGGGWHHMGTTRMHEDSKKGVVDVNCKLHGVGNLYVAGSSCFTTSGSACPTLNLVALSIRLSDHIKEALASSSGA